MAKHYGVKKVQSLPQGMLSVPRRHAAAAGMRRTSSCRKMPMANASSRNTTSRVTLVDDQISDCARMVAERKEKEGWFDISTLKEPYRVEGKKDDGVRSAEQFRWRLPKESFTGPVWRRPDRYVEGLRRDGSLGMDRFERPRMVTVQSAAVRPLLKHDEGKAAWKCGQTRPHRLWLARSQSIWGLFHPRHFAQKQVSLWL
jgi:threonine synthase